MSDPFPNLPRGHFKVIMADPAWTFRTYSDKGLKKSPQSHYRCMPLADIKALPVASLAAPDCALLMWGTAPMLPEAIDTLTAWGFTYKTAGAWHKRSSTGAKDAFGPGYIFRSATEFYLVGTRGKPAQKSRSIRNLIVAPVREHSRKPDEMRRNVEALWDGPYLELFAREAAPGWASWGDQPDKFRPETATLLDTAA